MSIKFLRVNVDPIDITQESPSSEKACQNGWGIFSGSEPDDGRIIWVCTGRPGRERGKFMSQQAGRSQYYSLRGYARFLQTWFLANGDKSYL